MPQIQEWQSRPLDEIYPMVFVDATHYSVRDNGAVRKLAAYVILAIKCDGRKEVLSIEIGENESAKYWLSVLNLLKNPRTQRHFDFMRRRTDWLERRSCDSISADRILSLYRSSSQKYSQVRGD